jgi:hypothetical protein
MDNIVIPIESNLQNAPLDLGAFVSNAVGVVLLVAALAAFVYLIIGGLQWITAGNDKNRFELAKDRITNAIIGLAIVALAWAIFLLLNHFFGLGVVGKAASPTSPTVPTNYGNGSVQGTCLYPTSRCCDDVSNSSCFCQNINYRAATYGSCNGGGGQTGILCGCVPR